MAAIGKRVFISYRGKYYDQATAMGDWLADHGYCERSIVFLPNSLCEPNELLSPFEYIELMGDILDQIHEADTFVYLKTNDYLDSYFTQAELIQWDRFKGTKTPALVYPCVMLGEGKFQVLQAEKLPQMDDNLRSLWANLSVSIERRYRGKLQPPFIGGIFARDYFMLGCGACGEHFVAHKDTLYGCLRSGQAVTCPHCGNNQFRLSESKRVGNFYRKPLLFEYLPSTRRPLRVLEYREMLSLLIDNQLPPRFKIFGEYKKPWYMLWV